MPVIVTFLYRVQYEPTVHFGKCDYEYVSDDHDGLDIEVINSLLHGMNSWRTQRGFVALTEEDVQVGIMSVSSDDRCYTSEHDYACFDFWFREGSQDVCYVKKERVELNRK